MNTSSIQDLENQAVDSALESNWDKAVEANKKILTIQKNDVQSYLRLGFAYLKLHKLNLAHDSYKKVISIQPQNIIASEYLEKIKLQKQDNSKTSQSKFVLDPQTFVELPGKTKAVNLGQLGQKNVLAILGIGEQVFISIRRRHVEVRTQSGEYVGVLPDDVGTRLTYFLENESIYSVYVQEATLSSVIVFIKETKKGKKVERMVSFPLDIPGSISKMVAQQHQNDLDDKKSENEGGASGSDSEKSPNSVVDPDNANEDEDEEDDIDNDLIKELGDDEKNEPEILGIETDEEEEEEE